MTLTMTKTAVAGDEPERPPYFARRVSEPSSIQWRECAAFETEWLRRLDRPAISDCVDITSTFLAIYTENGLLVACARVQKVHSILLVLSVSIERSLAGSSTQIGWLGLWQLICLVADVDMEIILLTHGLDTVARRMLDQTSINAFDPEGICIMSDYRHRLLRYYALTHDLLFGGVGLEDVLSLNQFNVATTGVGL